MSFTAVLIHQSLATATGLIFLFVNKKYGLVGVGNVVSLWENKFTYIDLRRILQPFGLISPFRQREG